MTCHSYTRRERILVFSSRFDRCQRPRPDVPGVAESFNFEIYDGGSWHKLPGIPLIWRVDDFLIVGYIYLIDENVLLLDTNTGMKFNLDLGPPDRPWRMVDAAAPPAPRGYYTLVGRLHLTKMLAYDDGESFDFPELSPLVLKYTQQGRFITLLHVNNSECKFCIIQTVLNSETLRPYLAVNVYRLDREEYENGKGKKLEDQGKWWIENPPLPGISTCKSFKFRLNIQAEDVSNLCFCSPF